MRILLLAVCLMFTSVAPAQQFVSWNEQKSRLVDTVNPVVSDECPTRIVVADVSINQDGKVTKVKKRKLAEIPKHLWAQIASLVKGQHYRPLLVDGQPKPVRTFVQVPCSRPTR